ncbi:benenodin family lasso peptide (plasmid) [Brevundimonas staleyi]|uniref:Benenodin family lasso peptide n=1 Tax=Brevundimonas staleyi TaxID=74326 RepID=A0ABW0FNK9_9CAUL
MSRDTQFIHEDLIDLGDVAVETKGPIVAPLDDQDTQQSHFPMLSDD